MNEGQRIVLRALDMSRVRDAEFHRLAVSSVDDAGGLVFVHTHGLRVIVSIDHHERGFWLHVSVSRPDSIPKWADMEFVRAVFFGPESTVIQIHAPRSKWVNVHPRVLHLQGSLDDSLAEYLAPVVDHFVRSHKQVK